MNISLSGLDWFIGCFVLFGSLIAGLYIAQKSKAGQSSSNFFLGGRKMTWPIIGASLFATNIGAEHLVGLSGDSYRYGLSAGSVELTTAITLGFSCAFPLRNIIKVTINVKAFLFIIQLFFIISFYLIQFPKVFQTLSKI